MNITRYDGTRFITEEEIDRDFTGQWVLISLINLPNPWEGGYLVASADGRDEMYPELSDIAYYDFNNKAKIIYGCKTRGDSLHVQILG